MALNENIPLAVEGVNPLGAIYEARGVKARGLANQAQAQNIDKQGQEMEKRSLIDGAVQLNEYLKANDLEGAKRFTQARRAAIKARNGNTQQTDDVYARLNSGDEKDIIGLKNDVNAILAMNQMAESGFADKAVATTRINPDTGELEQGYMVYNQKNKEVSFQAAPGGVVKEAPDVKRQRDLDARREFETFKTDQDFIRELNKQTQTPEGRIKLEGLKLDQIQKKAAVDASSLEAQDSLALVNRLMTSDLSKIYGRGESIYPELLRSQEGIDLIADRDRLVNVLKLASRGKLKGQGPISDNEGKMVADAATILSNPNISDAAAVRELERIMPTLQRSLTASQEQSAVGTPTKVLKFDAQGNQIQ